MPPGPQPEKAWPRCCPVSFAAACIRLQHLSHLATSSVFGRCAIQRFRRYTPQRPHPNRSPSRRASPAAVAGSVPPDPRVLPVDGPPATAVGLVSQTVKRGSRWRKPL